MHECVAATPNPCERFPGKSGSGAAWQINVVVTICGPAPCAGATAGESVWQLPAARHEGGETIRDTAERAAAATLPDGLKVIGNQL